jgi:hypothetical protein
MSKRAKTDTANERMNRDELNSEMMSNTRDADRAETRGGTNRGVQTINSPFPRPLTHDTIPAVAELIESRFARNLSDRG